MLDPVLDKQIIKKGLVLEDGVWVQSFGGSSAYISKSYPVFTHYVPVRFCADGNCFGLFQCQGSGPNPCVIPPPSNCGPVLCAV